MCFHWRELHARKREEEKKNKKKCRGRDVSRRSARLGQSGRLMLLYTGCHSASPPSPIGSQSPYQFLPRLSPSPCFPKTVFAQVDSDTVLNEPQSPTPFLHAWLQTVSSTRESGGACRELEVGAETWVHSGWEGAGSPGTNTERNKTKMEGKCKLQRCKEKERHKQRGEHQTGWKRRKRKTKNERE